MHLRFRVSIRFAGGRTGIAIDADSIIGPFLSLEDAVRYLKEGRHPVDIASVKKVDGSTVRLTWIGISV